MARQAAYQGINHPIQCRISHTCTGLWKVQVWLVCGGFGRAGILVILLIMTVLPAGDVKSHLPELVGRVHDHHEP
jgi:hypothetical protein